MGITHPCNPPHYGLWVNLHFFTMCICNIVFCPCYLFLLWNVVLKCLALCLITIIAARFPHLYACLTCSSVHASSLHALLAHHHLCYVDVYCVFYFFCYMLHFFVTSFWLVCVHIFSFVMIFLLWCNHPIMFPLPWKPNHCSHSVTVCLSPMLLHLI